MSRHLPTFEVAAPRGEIEVSGHGIVITCPTLAAAQAMADRRNADEQAQGGVR